MVNGTEILKEKDDFNTIFTKTGTMAYERQQNLKSIIDEDIGEIDFENKIIKFSDKEFPIQIIGTLFEKEDKWSWAWDNNDVGLPEDLIKDSEIINQIGIKYDIPEFTNAILTEVDINTAHILLMASSPLVNADAYYAVNENGLIIFVTIHSDEIPTTNDLDKFSHNFNDFQLDYPVNPKMALEGYTILKGYEYIEREDFSMAKVNKQRVIVGFSDRGKVTNIQTMK
jgi:hypothetical protein